MKMNIEVMPSCSIAYIRQTGAYGKGNVETMEQLKHWAKANNLMAQYLCEICVPIR